VSILFHGFLQERILHNRTGGHLSNRYPQENVISQGSSLGGTLFILAINSVTSGTILFAHELSIHVEATNHEKGRRRLLEAASLVITRFQNLPSEVPTTWCSSIANHPSHYLPCHTMVSLSPRLTPPKSSDSISHPTIYMTLTHETCEGQSSESN